MCSNVSETVAISLGTMPAHYDAKKEPFAFVLEFT